MFDDKKRIGDPRIRPVYYVRTGPPSRFSRTRLVWLFRVPRDKRVRRRSAATAAASFAPSDLVLSSLSFHRLLSLHSLLTPYSGRSTRQWHLAEETHRDGHTQDL